MELKIANIYCWCEHLLHYLKVEEDHPQTFHILEQKFKLSINHYYYYYHYHSTITFL